MPGDTVLLNGELIPAEAARLSAFDAGLTHGAGLFETFRAYHGVPFRLSAHRERLAASAQALSLPAPPERDPLATEVSRLLEVNGLRDARMRLTFTPGSTRIATVSQSAGALNPADDESFHPTLLLTAARMDALPGAAAGGGMIVCISSFRQQAGDPIAGHKTLSYLPRLLGQREAQRKRCGEALWFTPQNRLAEGSMSNVFLVRDGRLLTPPLDTPVLPGVTRAVVLELARSAGVAVEERPLDINDLLGANEVFLTNSVMELMPVLAIERHAVGDEKPGNVTKSLHEAYQAAVARECGAG